MGTRAVTVLFPGRNGCGWVSMLRTVQGEPCGRFGAQGPLSRLAPALGWVNGAGGWGVGCKSPIEKALSAGSRVLGLHLRGSLPVLQNHLSKCASLCAVNGRQPDLEREQDFFALVRARRWERTIPRICVPQKEEARSFSATGEGGRGVPRQRRTPVFIPSSLTLSHPSPGGQPLVTASWETPSVSAPQAYPFFLPSRRCLRDKETSRQPRIMRFGRTQR